MLLSRVYERGTIYGRCSKQAASYPADANNAHVAANLLNTCDRSLGSDGANDNIRSQIWAWSRQLGRATSSAHWQIDIMICVRD